jgi:hypothetical protein
MKARHLALLIGTSWVWLAACAKQEQVREIDWAKAALARNPEFEIVATDEAAGVFTVRDTATGSMRTIQLKDLIAAPLPAKTAAQPAAAPAPEPAASDENAEMPEDALAANQTTGPVDVPEASPGDGASLAQGPGYRITKATGDKPDTTGTMLEGPGYRIEKQGVERQDPSATDAASPEAPLANAERRTDPIICQGNRLMHIDGETMEFTGDAVIAEKGCDLYISNARIRAGGVGVIARQQGRVHIVNSTIGGTRASYEASEGGEIYVARSTFEGVGRRFDGGSMTDLGGNSYATR